MADENKTDKIEKEPPRTRHRIEKDTHYNRTNYN